MFVAVLGVPLSVAGWTYLLLERREAIEGMAANVAAQCPAAMGEDLSIAGARVEYGIPMIPVADVVTVSWGVLSFGRSLTIGFHGCGEAVRDKELLIQGLDKAYAELRAHVGKGWRPGPLRAARDAAEPPGSWLIDSSS